MDKRPPIWGTNDTLNGILSVPEGLDIDLSNRNAALTHLIESDQVNNWHNALQQLLRDLEITRWSQEPNRDSRSENQGTYVADCYRLTQAANKLQIIAEQQSPPRYEDIVKFTRLRKIAQRLAKIHSPEHPLNQVNQAIRHTNDDIIKKLILNRLARFKWLKEKLRADKIPAKTLRLQLAKASLEEMGTELEKIAIQWSVENNENLEMCLDLCFSTFTQEVISRFPKTGWVNIPYEVTELPGYKAQNMHCFVEIDADHLRNRFAQRAQRILKHAPEPPEVVRNKILALITANEDSLKN